MKRILLWMAVLLMSISLIACSSAKNEPGSPGGMAKTNEAAAPPKSAPAGERIRRSRQERRLVQPETKPAEPAAPAQPETKSEPAQGAETKPAPQPEAKPAQRAGTATGTAVGEQAGAASGSEAS
ncbi:hypothetical protein LJK87_20555 [Paenibacillus sp. P25]|nr:hypothetical protein LJK87_20555 [Paenibacillus sp. P25]